MTWNLFLSNDFANCSPERTILKASLTGRTSSPYHLAASPETAAAGGRFFNLAIDEKPAVYALDRALGK